MTDFLKRCHEILSEPMSENGWNELLEQCTNLSIQCKNESNINIDAFKLYNIESRDPSQRNSNIKMNQIIDKFSENNNDDVIDSINIKVENDKKDNIENQENMNINTNIQKEDEIIKVDETSNVAKDSKQFSYLYMINHMISI